MNTMRLGNKISTRKALAQEEETIDNTNSASNVEGEKDRIAAAEARGENCFANRLTARCLGITNKRPLVALKRR